MSLSECLSAARSSRRKNVMMIMLVMLLIIGQITIDHNLLSLTTDTQSHVPESEEYELSLTTDTQSHVPEGEEHELSHCKMRNLSSSNYDYKALKHSNLAAAKCLSFKCNKNVTHCDNELPTNYDGPEPPCCAHLLRDMSRIFDDAMCSLGLDYLASFGTLLGFVRSDRIIPWTSDLDYVVPSEDVAGALFALWDAKTTGMAHVYQQIDRMCITGDFAGGKLKENWEGGRLPHMIYKSYVPYIDIYIGKNISGVGKYKTFGPCRHLYGDVFPTKRTHVYNRTFAQNMPANPEQLLITKYGQDWRVPPNVTRGHGDTYGGHALCRQIR